MRVEIEDIGFTLSIRIRTRKYYRHKWYLYLNGVKMGDVKERINYKDWNQRRRN